MKNKPKIIRTVISRFPTRNKALAFHDVMKNRMHLLTEAKVRIAISAQIGEAKVMTIGIYDSEEDFKKGSIMLKEILETIKLWMEVMIYCRVILLSLLRENNKQLLN